MASLIYPKGAEAIMSKLIDLSADTIKAYLVKTGVGHYVIDAASDQYLSAIAAGDRVQSFTLSSKSVTGGVFDAADGTFSAVTAGAVCGAIVLVWDTGTAATSRLLAYLDGTTVTSLPITADGSDIVCAWPNGASKIFSMC